MQHRRDLSDRPPFAVRNREGFALITVIWGLGLLTLLGATVIVGARYRVRTAQADGSVLASAAAAESAVNFAIASILSSAPNTSFPTRCRMPGGEQADIVVEEEVGKIDLNAASQPILERFFTALAQDKTRGARIAQSIVHFRRPPPRKEAGNQTTASDNRTTQTNAANDAKISSFSSILELDQIDGMSPTLLRSAMRYTTTLSGRPQPIPEAMTPALRLVMGLELGRANRRRPALPGHFTVRAHVRANDGSLYIREALVSIGATSTQSYTIREWRRGDIVGGSMDALRAREPVQACIKF
ncbi:hypothetical protein WHZ78_07205 [Bradyrhizobium symbiodeficiens]|uniref:hypothetical protein n=1 Tax=Bradyrhizobium symbiodeficiens TaxID=1404367 RepID=UPI0030CE9569